MAMAVLAGWQWNIDVLRRPLPGAVAMNPTTALGFLFAAFSFLCFRSGSSGGLGKSTPLRQTLGRLFAWIVIAAGVVCLCGYPVSAIAGFDRLLYSGRLRLDAQKYNLSNRMGIITACCFILAGYSLLRVGSMAESLKKDRWFPMERAAVVIGFLALFSLVGYLYRVPEFYGPLRYLRMAFHSAFCFLLLASAILIVSPRRGIMGVLTGNLTGSLTLRRLLPFAFLLPVLLGELRLIGFWRGYFTTELGVLLLVLSIILCFVYIVWHNALLLNKRDAQRQQAMSELVASESRWEGMVNSVRDYAIFLVGKDGRVLTWNEGAERIKGYQPEEIIGKPISVFYTDEEKAESEPARNLAAAAAAGRHYSEGWRVRKNGERFWAEVVFTAIYDDEHRVQAFAKITRDTTEQKLAQEKIGYLARLIEDTSDAFISTDTALRIVTWNKAAQNLYGYSVDEAIGAVFGDLLRNQAEDRIRRSIRLELREKGYWRGEVKLLTKQDQVLDIALSISATRDERDVFNGYILVCLDMTERVSMEKRLQEFNELLEREVNEKTAELREIFERVTDAFMAYDKEGNVVFVNARAMEMNRTRGLDLQGKNIWTEVPVSATSSFGEHFRLAMASQEEQHFEMYSTALDLWLEAHMYPSPNGISQFYRDITVQHKVQQQLETSNAELRDLASHLTDVREEERAAMAREVHDELGQQLTGLKMDLAMMARKLSEETREWLKEKIEATQGLLDTTIRTVRKIASELRPSILDDLGLIAALDWQAQEFGKRLDISTTFETNGDGIGLPPAVSIGLFRICQESLTNVARHAAAKHVAISLLEEKDQVILAIRDDGRGIDPEKLNRKGKTLGLLGMKERALMMGGILAIKSEPGVGTTLSVKVPIEQTTNPK